MRMCIYGGLPGHGEGRDNCIAGRDGFDLVPSLDHCAHELMAHDKSCRRWLVAAVNVQLSWVMSVLYVLSVGPFR